MESGCRSSTGSVSADPCRSTRFLAEAFSKTGGAGLAIGRGPVYVTGHYKRPIRFCQGYIALLPPGRRKGRATSTRQPVSWSNVATIWPTNSSIGADFYGSSRIKAPHPPCSVLSQRLAPAWGTPSTRHPTAVSPLRNAYWREGGSREDGSKPRAVIERAVMLKLLWLEP